VLEQGGVNDLKKFIKVPHLLPSSPHHARVAHARTHARTHTHTRTHAPPHDTHTHTRTTARHTHTRALTIFVRGCSYTTRRASWRARC
jgi:hypothetical protein